ncbi:MAG: amino acid adenylation domain-containing protein [Muribaculaceae bacterium]|nr:amino acid adenylation domain-containing protein [Muribaculaceae bacterium]
MKRISPLSQIQLGIYIECQSHQGEAFYNLPYLYTFGRDIDIERLRNAAETAVKAHPTMFTRIVADEGEPKQVLDLENEQWSLTAERVSDIEVVKRELIKPYDLDGGRLFSIRLFYDDNHTCLFIDIHHIIGDGTSISGVLIKDIEAAYLGKEIAEEALTLADVADNEAEMRNSAALDEDRKWFEHEYALDDTFTPILPDLENPVHSENSIYRTINIDMARVDAFCKENGVFKSTLFTSAYSFLLAKFNNEKKSYFTTIYNGRGDKRLAHSIGMFVRTVPVFAAFDDETRVIDFLLAGQKQMSGCRKHEAYSYGDFVTELKPQNKSMFAWHGMLFSDDKLCGVPMVYERLCNSTLEEPLYLKAFIHDGHYHIKAEYNSNEYSAELINQVLESYENVVLGLVNCEYLRDIDIASPSQVATLDTFNDTATDNDTSLTVAQLFCRQAKATPDNTAVVYAGKAYTYAEVDRITDRIASRLAAEGLSREDVVSIIIPRSEWMVIASLGALKAGCAYQPLDPSYPKERLNFMMADAGAKFLIADRSLRDIVDDYKGNVLFTDEIASLPEAEHLKVDAAPSDLFILLYTSGSTGTPKGVMLENRNIVSFCNWYKRYYGLTADCRVAAYASYGFDACMMDLYPALTHGAAVHIIPEEIRLDLIALNEYFEENGITHSFMTTQVGYQFATSVKNHSLHHLSVGGEKLATLTPPTDYKFHNCYGPTECTIFTTTYYFDKKINDIPIGRPVDNLHLYIVGADGRRVPVGASGELWVSGPQVGRGYLNRPDINDKTFVANPFDNTPGYERCYRTGDIVRYLPDGNVQFIGRKDGQVKIRGFRIELKEVESIVREFPGITDATVQAFDEEGGGKYIAAYIVSDKEIDIAALEDFIRENKPPYMVPAVTMQIPAIPLNQNQKVNRKALPKPEKKAQEKKAIDIPMNRLETELHDIAAEIIGNGDFSVVDILGYAGLTSISSIKLATQVYKRYGVKIDSKTLVKEGTIQTIENAIIDSLLNKEEAAPAATTETAKEEVLSAPLSGPQEGIYYECQKNPTEVIYNIPVKLTYPSSVGGDVLADAVRRVIAAHPILTAHFEQTDDGVMQVIDPKAEPLVELLLKTDAELDEFGHDFVRPFNLAKAPLYRATVVQTESCATLFLDVHHLVFDGGSLDLVVNQISDALEGRAITPESTGYIDFVNTDRSEAFGKAKEFFATAMQDCEEASEIAPEMRPGDALGHVAETFHPIDFERLSARCKELGVTPAHLTLAATQYVVGRYSNSHNVYICTISSGRSDVTIADTVGMFVNTLALAAKIGDQSVEQYVKEVSESFDASLRHENYPFARVAADYGFYPAVAFAYQVGVISDYKVNGETVKYDSLELPIPKFKIDITVEKIGGEIGFRVRYDDSLYTPWLMTTLAESLATTLDNIMSADASSPIKKVSMMTDARRAETIAASYGGDLRFDIGKTVANIFNENALRTPDALAVADRDNEITYGEMNRRANVLAQRLIASGVKPNMFVALLLERTIDFPIAVLACHKAGAAYLPLDLEYPAERLLYMLENSEAPMMITTHEVLASKKEEGPFDVENTLFIDDVDFTADAEPIDLSKPDGLAYMIYTSGSTGKPKGAMLHHAGLMNMVETIIHKANINASDRIAHHRSFSFDAHVGDLYPVLMMGGSLHIMPSEIRKDLEAIYKFLVDRKITGGGYTTSMAILMINNFDLPVRYISGGGEKMAGVSSDTYDIINVYGPTESTNDTNIFTIPRGTKMDNIPIGRAVNNCWSFMCDTDGNLLPHGVAGEHCFAGIQVGRGYWQLPERTAQSFGDCPFVTTDLHERKVRMYHTGDLCRYNIDGEVEYVSRIDSQVKVSGFRIELGEIDSFARQFPGIHEEAAAVKTIGNSKYVCLFYTVKEGAEVDNTALKEYLESTTLASYMVPKVYMKINEMPRTPSGKISHKQLPQPDLSELSQYVAPRNDVERTLCDIFARMLSLDRIGIYDDFFLLGGTSLIVTRVVLDAVKAGYNITYGDVFKYKTAAALAEFLNGGAQIDEDAEARDRNLRDYDYTAINNLLADNNLDSFKEDECHPIGNALLTGATGFLGIHVLNELISSGSGKIFCLVRGKTLDAAERRLKNLMFYYFGDAFDELFGTRIFVVQGDVTQPFTVDDHIDTVFNCAANVKHFSKGTDIEDVNIGGANTCIEFCLATGARLVHVSTMSTGGILFADRERETNVFDEQHLYISQNLDIQYTYSKFIAERNILQAIIDRGLKAKIARVGNLSARSTDGEFQINFNTNSFFGRLRVNQMLRACPYEEMDKPFEFSPINEVAHAIVLLATTPDKCCLFHPYNVHHEPKYDIIEQLIQLGYPIDWVENEEFDARLEETKADPEKAERLAGMIAYQNMGHGRAITPIVNVNEQTMQILYRLGFRWTATSWDYANRFLTAIKGLGFFD